MGVSKQKRMEGERKTKNKMKTGKIKVKAEKWKMEIKT
jgi:hypothetical protein